MKIYNTPDEVYKQGKKILNKSIINFIPKEELPSIQNYLLLYKNRRKGYLGDLVETYLFGIPNNSKSEADFNIAGVELKTSPIKKNKNNSYSAKERLVFSDINYSEIVKEKWENSSFLKKNKLLLLLLYLYEMDKSILEYQFKYAELLNLLSDLPREDIFQIQKDWELIVKKIRSGNAHLLSEGDTYYLGACTKAKDSTVVTDQPHSVKKAKPRAFCFKQSYITMLLRNSLGIDLDKYESIYKTESDFTKSIEEVVGNKLTKYLGKTDSEIINENGWIINRDSKQYKRLIANYLLTNSPNKKIAELEKANVVLKVLTLEHTGTLKESISFKAFDYKNLQYEQWENQKNGKMAEFHELLETKKFLFVVFQKIKDSKELILRSYKFWNFPQEDMPDAEKVFSLTKKCINDGTYELLPKISENRVAHVRPHGRDKEDKILTPQGTFEVRRSFWLNAKYIEKVIV